METNDRFIVIPTTMKNFYSIKDQEKDKTYPIGCKYNANDLAKTMNELYGGKNEIKNCLEKK